MQLSFPNSQILDTIWEDTVWIWLSRETQVESVECEFQTSSSWVFEFEFELSVTRRRVHRRVTNNSNSKSQLDDYEPSLNVLQSKIDGGLEPTSTTCCGCTVYQRLQEQTWQVMEGRYGYLKHLLLCPLLHKYKYKYKKGKTSLDLLEQEIVSGSGISWAICKSALRPRQITTLTSHHSVFLQAGCPSFRPTNSIKALKAVVNKKG